MSNIFNDLNKMVNTIQKVDRLLSEKPKTKYITKRFTEDEMHTLLMALDCFYDNESQEDEFDYCKKIKILKNKLK